MNALLHPIVVLSLTSFPLAIVCLNPVSVQCSTSPLLVASGSNAVFTVQTVPNVPLIRWMDSTATTLAMWVNGGPVLMSVQQFQGRITVSATQFTISSSQISDSGNYSVSVEPSSTSGLSVNTCSVQLKVFDAVSGVSLSLPSLPLEGGNVSVSCSWTAGSQVSVVWGKAGAPLSSDSHISISSGSLLVISASRQDSGQYSCTVSNPVSAQTAKGNLNVYYGPDSPQLTKSSSQCVGGGDATVGQSVLLSCTSASLPPASFTWEINGQTVSSSQSASGSLTLQIFSTNQSGSYVCTAHNGITGGTSTQQINLAIVGTCLSAGAVAGIVVACFVALIIIIVVIIVLLRQRNVDRRVKNNIELQKTNPNEGMTIANRALVNENHPDPTLHSSLPQNITNHNNGNISTMAQNIARNSLHHNGHLNTDEFQHNFSAVPDNGHQISNNSTNPNNELPRSFPQHTPNIVIQTGNSQPGALAPTVHVSLNALPHTDQFNTQPQTVHVNLNTYPPDAQQTAWQHADQRESALHSQHTNANLSHTELLNSNQHNNLIQTNQTNAIRQLTNSSHQNHSQSALQNSRSGNQTLNNASANEFQQTNSLIQTGYSHHSNQTNANRRNANLRSTREEQTRRSNRYRTNNQFDSTNTNLQQIPWDRLRGTPAYPNQEVESSDSSESSDWMPRPPQEANQRGRSTQRQHEAELSSRFTEAAPSPQRRDMHRPVMHSQSQLDPNLWSQVVEQMQVQSPRRALPQTESSQGQNPIPIGQPRGTTIPQTHPQRHHEPEFSNRTTQAVSSPQRRDLQRPTVHSQSHMDPNLFSHVQSQIPRHALPQTEPSRGQNPIPIGQPQGTTITQTHPQAQTTTRTQEVSAQPVVSLTEAALRQHTAQTNNTFANRNLQTQAALQNPGPPQPVPQVNKAGKTAPTPPPVLRPAEFQTLPRERTQKVQPVRVQHRHRSPNAHRQTHIRHISPQRMPGMHHMHGHPMHMQQVHRGRPRR